MTANDPLSRFLAPRAGFAFALMRILVGAMFACHGLQKVFGVLAEHAEAAPEPMKPQIWIGGVIELITGTLMALGLFTTWAAFLASGTMAVAYVQFHWKLDLGPRLFPIVNKGELALVYALLFLYIACRGPGRLSLDALVRRQV